MMDINLIIKLIINLIIKFNLRMGRAFVCHVIVISRVNCDGTMQLVLLLFFYKDGCDNLIQP